MTNRVTIKRIPAPELKPMSKNGNVGTQAMTYYWHVVVNEITVGSEPLLRNAKLLASDFAKTWTITR
jgi:hypothetical protein